jgi:hypothetical protein
MRQQYAQSQVPTQGKDAVPYPTWLEIANKMFKHGAEAFVGEILGAAGAGGSLANIPFEPAVIVASDAAVPLLQAQLPGSAAKVDIDMITGAAAAAAIPAAVQQPDGTWTLTLPTGLAPDGNTVSLLILGFRDVGGSL